MGRNTRAEEWAVWWGVLLLVSVSVHEDCEPVPFLHLEMEPISSHLGEETLCYPGVNRHPHVRVSTLSIFKIFYILKWNALPCLCATSGPVLSILSGKVETASTLLGLPSVSLNVGVPFPLCPSHWRGWRAEGTVQSWGSPVWLHGQVFVSDFLNCPYKPASVWKLREKLNFHQRLLLQLNQ